MWRNRVFIYGNFDTCHPYIIFSLIDLQRGFYKSFPCHTTEDTEVWQNNPSDLERSRSTVWPASGDRVRPFSLKSKSVSDFQADKNEIDNPPARDQLSSRLAALGYP